MSFSLKPTPEERAYFEGISEIKQEYKSGRIKVLKLVHEWAKLESVYGEQHYDPIEISEVLGISIAAFYRALAQLESESLIEVEKRPRISLPGGSR